MAARTLFPRLSNTMQKNVQVPDVYGGMGYLAFGQKNVAIAPAAGNITVAELSNALPSTDADWLDIRGYRFAIFELWCNNCVNIASVFCRVGFSIFGGDIPATDYPTDSLGGTGITGTQNIVQLAASGAGFNMKRFQLDLHAPLAFAKTAPDLAAYALSPSGIGAPFMRWALLVTLTLPANPGSIEVLCLDGYFRKG